MKKKHFLFFDYQFNTQNKQQPTKKEKEYINI